MKEVKRQVNLTLKIISFRCVTETFRINGIDADDTDFGDKFDRCPQLAEPYGCGFMAFTRASSTTEVLERYSITDEEYGVICAQLEMGLTFGRCSWCV